MRIAKAMTALQVAALRKPGTYAVGGEPGLQIRIPDPDSNGARYWILRYLLGGARRHMGIGKYPDVTLAQARDKAHAARKMIAEGHDPILARVKARSANIEASASEKTFAEAVTSFLKSKGRRIGKKGNAKHAQQWERTLAQYAKPLNAMLCSDIKTAHVHAALLPIWELIPETASRVRQRIAKVLDHARVHGWRSGENPAKWDGNLSELLPPPPSADQRAHHRYLKPPDMHEFVTKLRAANGTAARALELLILTAARSGEIRAATWSEFDLDAGLWTIPKDRMKAGREHRVPLSKPALALLKSLTRVEGNDLVFPAPRSKTVMSDMTMTAVLRRLEVDATVHGMRSSFRVWTQDSTSYPREMAEVALSHDVGTSVEQAYARSDLLEKRRRMMQAWADYIAKPAVPAGGTVTPINRRAHS